MATFSWRRQSPQYSEHVQFNEEMHAAFMVIPEHLRRPVDTWMQMMTEVFGHFLDHPECATDDEHLTYDVEAFAIRTLGQWAEQDIADLDFVREMAHRAALETQKILDEMIEALRKHL